MMQDSEPQVLGQDQGFETVSWSEEDTSPTPPQSALQFWLKMLAAWQGNMKHRETSIFHRNLRENDLCLLWIKCYWNLSHSKDSLKISAVYVRVCVTAQDRALNKVLPVGRTLDTLAMFL